MFKFREKGILPSHKDLHDESKYLYCTYCTKDNFINMFDGVTTQKPYRVMITQVDRFISFVVVFLKKHLELKGQYKKETKDSMLKTTLDMVVTLDKITRDAKKVSSKNFNNFAMNCKDKSKLDLSEQRRRQNNKAAYQTYKNIVDEAIKEALKE